MEHEAHQPELTYLEIDRYERLVNGLFRRCEKWLEGKISGEALTKTFNHVRQKRYAISELNGKPEDYDWDALPDELFERADRLESMQLSTLMQVIEKTEKTLTTKKRHSSIDRAYYFGIHSVEYGFEP